MLTRNSNKESQSWDTVKPDNYSFYFFILNRFKQLYCALKLISVFRKLNRIWIQLPCVFVLKKVSKKKQNCEKNMLLWEKSLNCEIKVTITSLIIFFLEFWEKRSELQDFNSEFSEKDLKW